MDKQSISKVKSPCINNCCLNNDDVCLGCCRTLDEILAWSQSTDLQRADIVKSAEARCSKKRVN